MNFSRSNSGLLNDSAAVSNPISNRFLFALLAVAAAFVVSLVGSSQWASADTGSTTPDPSIPAPRHVVAKPGDASAAVAWNKPAETDDPVVIDGYVVIAHPSGITLESTADDTLVIVEGLENGIEYTFTVVAFNSDGRGEVSEHSNPVTPEAGLVLDEEKLERLRAHLRKLAKEARERLARAQEKARDHLAKHSDRIENWLHDHNDRANKRLDKAVDKAREKDQKQSENARNWFERLKQQLAKKLERAEGTERYDELRERTANQLDKAKDKLSDRLENSSRKTEARIKNAEETTENRIEKAEQRAASSIEKVERRLGDRISEMQDRLRELLRRLRNHWLERQGNAG